MSKEDYGPIDEKNQYYDPDSDSIRWRADNELGKRAHSLAVLPKGLKGFADPATRAKAEASRKARFLLRNETALIEFAKEHAPNGKEINDIEDALDIVVRMPMFKRAIAGNIAAQGKILDILKLGPQHDKPQLIETTQHTYYQLVFTDPLVLESFIEQQEKLGRLDRSQAAQEAYDTWDNDEPITVELPR